MIKSIEYFEELKFLSIRNNKLTTVHCFSNDLITLNISNNKELTQFLRYLNKSESLDVTNNDKLTTLSCCGDQL